ncbi:hypothetical protein AVEN_244172-1 [Araneus ventricosus]|uniref:Uncharacterized protein n=1 Tax=Araneus ventricosus TaxID=182803 RepID=A0A4Y2GCK5_ARAVE|nr:hypothetical protein AVEN_244172-1 [Araneus ventricosus]
MRSVSAFLVVREPWKWVGTMMMEEGGGKGIDGNFSTRYHTHRFKNQSKLEMRITFQPLTSKSEVLNLWYAPLGVQDLSFRGTRREECVDQLERLWSFVCSASWKAGELRAIESAVTVIISDFLTVCVAKSESAVTVIISELLSVCDVNLLPVLRVS